MGQQSPEKEKAGWTRLSCASCLDGQKIKKGSGMGISIPLASESLVRAAQWAGKRHLIRT